MEKAPFLAVSRIRIGTDGDGVRSLAVFYGCPLRCRYCLNPQTISPESKPKILTSADLYELLKKNDLYYRATNGGITFGGGEPLLHPAFLREMTGLAPEWNYWAETSLNVPYENIEQVADFLDTFVVDIKSADRDIYQSYTGQDNERVKANLQKLVQRVGEDRVIVRVPQIPGYTTPESIRSTLEWVSSLGCIKTDCFTYRLPKP